VTVSVEKAGGGEGAFGKGKRVPMPFGEFLECLERGEEGLYMTTQEVSGVQVGLNHPCVIFRVCYLKRRPRSTKCLILVRHGPLQLAGTVCTPASDQLHGQTVPNITLLVPYHVGNSPPSVTKQGRHKWGTSWGSVACSRFGIPQAEVHWISA